MSTRIHAARFSIILLLTLTALFGATPSAKKEKPEKKESEAARQNPALREYFKERALALQPDLTENKTLLNSRVDYLIDNFVKEVLQSTERMIRDAEELKEIATRTDITSLDKAAIEKIKGRVDVIKSIAKGLQLQLHFLTLALNLDTKNIGVDTHAVDRKRIPQEINSLVSLTDEFEKELDEFLFPKSRAVSIENLQKSALPILLKKIERYADKVENTMKKM